MCAPAGTHVIGMRCPYHPERPATIPVPPNLDDDGGWIGWIPDCCGLPAWRCAEGALLPMDAQYCTFHGCPRPHLGRVVHEVAGDVVRAAILERSLELPPLSDGSSTPCLAGNVLVYLSEGGRLVALDLGSGATLFLAAQLRAAALRVDGGRIVGALRTEVGIRYVSWETRDVREALRHGETGVRSAPATGAGANLLGLPRDATRLHVGSGLLRIVVEHDPLDGGEADAYHRVTGVEPGPWLVRRFPNPDGPPLHHPDLRPQVLHQVPVPIPGGVLVLGQLRVLGRVVAGAVLVPTSGGTDGA